MRLFLVALAVISFMVASTNLNAFTPPITASTPPMSKRAIISSSATTNDGRPLINNNNAINNNQIDTTRKSILHRLLRSSPSNNNIRGNSYGTVNNSTVLSPADAALAVGVKPTKPDATKNEWQHAWKIHRFVMKILHAVDGCKPKDSKLALACLWWKSISGNDITSLVYDYGLSYDLLPPISRGIVHGRLCKLYPRLHHANVEIRTAYLDKSVVNIINSILSDNDDAQLTEKRKKKKIRLIVMGGGYDTRSIKLLERTLLLQNNETSPYYKLLKQKYQLSRRRRGLWNRILLRRRRRTLPSNSFDNITSSSLNEYDLECHELDLPEVVRAKRQLLHTRLFKRRPWLQQQQHVGSSNTIEYPNLISVDFNNLNDTRDALEGILLSSNTSDDTNCEVYNIILFEGVMIYLDEGIPNSLLELCSGILNKANSTPTSSSPSTTAAYLCFADRLENIPGGDLDAAHIEMNRTGWKLIDWLPKPGLARHQGVAHLAVERS